MTMIMDKVWKLEELRGRPVEDVLREVARAGETMMVALEDGGIIAVTPPPLLKPLPELEGFVPEGWKDAIYGE